MSELHSTGVPTPFVLELSIEVDDCHACEREAHKALAQCRVDRNREFFRSSVEDALRKILPRLGTYRILEARAAFSIKAIEKEFERRKLEAAKQQQKREQELATQRKAHEERRRIVEQAIAVERQNMISLGPRPIMRDIPLIGMALIFAYFPIPIGWLVWLGCFRIFEKNNETTGIVCMTLVAAGFLCNQIQKSYEREYKRLMAPFEPFDQKLSELQKELDGI